VIHNSGLKYEEDKLPIPEVSEGQFSRSDALALGKLHKISLHQFFFSDLVPFYKIAVPNIDYEFVTNIVHFSFDPASGVTKISGWGGLSPEHF